MDLRRIYAYSQNANRQLREFAAQHPGAEDRPIQTIGDYKTVRQLLTHMAGAEERWVRGAIGGQELVTRFEERAPDSLEGLYTYWDDLRAETLAELDLDPDEVFTYELKRWNKQVVMTREEILFHIANHETNHRAQVMMVYQILGIDPPNFDYPLLKG